MNGDDAAALEDPESDSEEGTFKKMLRREEMRILLIN